MAEDRTPRDAGEDHVYLLPISALDDYLGFMREYPVDAANLDRAALAADWKSAQAAMDRLRKSEARWADNPPLAELPASMKSLTARVLADPIFAKAYSDAPVEFSLVELDRLVVSQKLVSAGHIERLKARLGAKYTPEDLFRFCLPYDHPPTHHRASRISDDTFSFISESNDLRFQEALLLKPEQVSGYQSVGPVAGFLALVVGFGSNYLSAVVVDGRLVLNNGHHRACALRDMGITHAPCVIQRVTHPDEFDVLVPRAVRRNREFYLEEPRPPALKDYFNPKLSRLVQLALTSKEVRVRYSVEEMDIP